MAMADSGLNRAQWAQWAVATGIAGLVMVVTMLGFAHTVVYPRERGVLMEQDYRRHVDKVERRLISIENKIDSLKDLYYRDKIQTQGG